MLPFLSAVKAECDAVDPRLWYALLALLVGGIVAAWRKWRPGSFERLPPRVQALPAILLAAVTAGGAAADLKKAAVDAVLGAMFGGLGAIGGHHALKAAGLVGGSGPASKRPPAVPPVLGGLLLLVLALPALPVGCAGWTRKDTRTVLDVAHTICAMANAANLDAPALMQACGIAEDLLPEVERIVSAQRAELARAASKSGACPPSPAASTGRP
jgi:hypothetical protein